MKYHLLSKKAQVQSIAPAILALVFAAIVLVFGLIITQALRDNPIVTVGASGTIINESLGFNASGAGLTQTLSANDFPAGACGTITFARNGSVGNEIQSLNWTQAGCVITNLTATYSTNDWKVDYPFTRGGEAYIATNKTIAGLATFADFWEIIVLAIVITVVIGLLLVVFGGRSRR